MALWKNKAFVLFTLFLVGCGENRPGKVNNTEEPSTKLQIQGSEFLVLEDKGLEITTSPETVLGTGKILFKDARPDEDSHYALKFLLVDGGSLSLVSHCNKTLDNGVKLVFQRQGTTLKVNLLAGSENYDVSSDFAAVPADKSVSVDIDVHGHGHIIVWVGADKFEYAFSTKVSGRLWGIELNTSTLLGAQAGKAKEEG